MSKSDSSEWSFNLRTRAGASAWDSSSSESESDARAGASRAEHTSRKPQETGENTGLEAEETVTYKRNPFSIAKINAALRGDSLRTTTNVATSNDLVKEKPTVNPQKITISDRLKRQALKSTPVSKPPAAIPPSQPIRPKLNAPAQVPDSTNSTNSAQTTRSNRNNPPSLKSAALKSLPLHRSPQSGNNSLLSSKPSTHSTQEPQKRSSNAPRNATFTRSTQHNGYQNIARASFHRKLGQNPTSYTDSAIDELFSSPSRPVSKRNAKTYDVAHFSSPHMLHYYGTGHINPQRFSSPALLECRQPQHDPNFLTTNWSPATPDAGEIDEFRDFYSTTQQKGAYTLQDQFPQDHDSPFPSTNVLVPSSADRLRPLSSAAPTPHQAQSSKSSPQRSDILPKRSKLDRPIRPKKDAYDLRLGDPDEEFSTLHVKKKQKLGPSPVKVKRTQKFRIPALTGQLPPGTRTGMSATSGRRVITFLPPPLQSKDIGRSEGGRVARRGSQAYPSPKRSDDSPMASSSPPHSPIASSTCGTKIAHVSGRRSTMNRFEPPSPPPSDDRAHALQSPLKNSYDAEVDFDIHSVAGRYPQTKAARRQVRA